MSRALSGNLNSGFVGQEGSREAAAMISSLDAEKDSQIKSGVGGVFPTEEVL